MPLHFLAALLTLALGSTALAQKIQRPTGFLGVAFGSAPADVLRVLGSRAGATIPEEIPTTFDKLELTGGNFAGQEALKWTLEFADRKFAAATVILKTEGNGMAVYRELQKNLVAKYGPASGEKRAERDDARKSANTGRREETFGKMAYWKFIPTLAEKGARLIICEAAGADGKEVTDESKVQVTLQYIDETLLPSAARRVTHPGSKTGPAVKREDL
ncbi:MAG: hypothetical protein K8R23_11740 [Chthoniobacter sp.]|nr:hypothetical protein [Chthoniobacter sp.]